MLLINHLHTDDVQGKRVITAFKKALGMWWKQGGKEKAKRPCATVFLTYCALFNNQLLNWLERDETSENLTIQTEMLIKTSLKHTVHNPCKRKKLY